MKILSPLLRRWLEARSVRRRKMQLRCYRSKTWNSTLCGRILRISRVLLRGRARILGYWDVKAPSTSVRMGISVRRAPPCPFLREDNNIPLTCDLNHPQRRRLGHPALRPTLSLRYRRIEIASSSGCRPCRPCLRLNRVNPKKVKKLLLDGVPSSVRYLVWSYLTDGKARCVPDVYPQLFERTLVKQGNFLLGGI
jgi:hypothetical protein